MQLSGNVYEKVRELLERELEELERRRQMLELILSILDACTGAGEAGAEVEEVKAGDLLVARIVRGKGGVRIVFEEELSSSSPYAKYLLRTLRSLEEDYGVKYDVEERDGVIRSIRVSGLSEEAYEELQAALEFVARKLARLHARAQGRS